MFWFGCVPSSVVVFGVLQCIILYYAYLYRMLWGEDWQQHLRRDGYSFLSRPKGHRTNPGTEAEPQQIVTQGYSHAYSTTFHS